MDQTQEKEMPPVRGAPLKLQIGLAFLAFILIGAAEAGLGVLIPSLRGHYGVDKATVSFIFLAGTCGYLLAAFSSGPITEKLGHKTFLMLGVCLFIFGAVIVILTPPFPVVVGVWLLIGCGIAMIDAGLNSYVAELPRPTKLLNYLHAFYGIGALTGPLVASTILVLNISWNLTYLVWITVALIVLAGFAILYDSRSKAHHEVTGSEGRGSPLGSVLKMRAIWLTAFFLIFYVGTEVSLGNWGYSYLTEERREVPLLSGWFITGYWLGLTLGRLTLANLAERLGNKRLVQLCLVGTVVGVLLIWLLPFTLASAIGLILAGFSLGPIFPTIIAIISEEVPASLRSSAIGFLVSGGSMGAAFLPWLAGNLAEQFGLWSLMPYIIFTTVIMLGFWLALQAQSHKKDPTVKHPVES
jgi:fucose permease